MALQIERITATKGSFSLSASFEVSAGSTVAVIGPSGAGKSTLFDVIAGFLTPETGQVRWQSQDLNPLSPGKRPVAMLFQDNNLFPHLDVGQNIGLALSQRRLKPSEKEAVERVLERVGLAGMSKRKLSELSGGQISRVALARLLLQDRPLWLLDEPFSALGPGLKAEMLKLVKDVVSENGATVLMITHDPKDAIGFAEQSLLVLGEEIGNPVNTQEVLDNPPDALKNYLGH